jgi:hypothetical protein
MELHSLFHSQHRLPYAFLSRTMTISTPFMLLCKNRFLHAALTFASRLINRAPSNREVVHVQEREKRQKDTAMGHVHVSTCLWNISELSIRHHSTDAKMVPHQNHG